MRTRKHSQSVQDISRELQLLRRRAARQKRLSSSNGDAWQTWSATMSQTMTLVSKLSSTPVLDIQELVVKFDAILWVIEVNESLLDRGDERRLRAFGRELRRLERVGSGQNGQ